MIGVSSIENIYLSKAALINKRDAIASEWKVTFSDERIVTYRITIIKGRLDSEDYNENIYIQIDNCSISKLRPKYVFSKGKKITLKREPLKIFYAIFEDSFNDFINEDRLSFEKISKNKDKWIQAIEKRLRNHIINEPAIAAEECSPLLPAAGHRLSLRDGSTYPNDDNVYNKFLKIFCCCFY